MANNNSLRDEARLYEGEGSALGFVKVTVEESEGDMLGQNRGDTSVELAKILRQSEGKAFRGQKRPFEDHEDLAARPGASSKKTVIIR